MDLSSLPPLREIIHDYGLRAEKSLGQNFILDQNLTDKIVRVAGDISSHHIFEIGPGPGGLTRSILRANPAHVTAVEYDSRAIKALQSLEASAGRKLTLLQSDALRTDLTQYEPIIKRLIIANLPYNIATPLLIQWLQQIREAPQVFDQMILMFQKEVAERIVAVPNQKAYGRLSVISQWLCEVNIAFDVPASAFVPPPKVTSSIVHFCPRQRGAGAPLFQTMEKLTSLAFGQRRKMIRSSLKPYLSCFSRAQLNEESRAENLSVEDYINLAKQIETA